jgi:hypothetical protein
LRLNKDFNLTEIYNLDIYDPSHFSLSSIKNRNIFNFLLYISKKDNIDINDNNIPYNDEIDYQRFKESKNKIYESLINNEIINKYNNNELLSEININFTYNKLYIFPENNIDDTNVNKKYSNVNMSLLYLDYIPSENFENIKKLIHDNNVNNNGKSSSIYIKIKEEQIKTIKLLENAQSVFECPKCNRSYTLDQNSFYFCNICKENSFFCEECYRGFYDSVKIKKKKKIKEENNIFHEHHLILFFKYNQNKSSYIIKEEYDKYIDILGNNKLKRIYKLDCSICSNSKSLINSNIIISHLKKRKVVNINKNENMEVIICDKCFKSINFTNIIDKENSNNNIIIL